MIYVRYTNIINDETGDAFYNGASSITIDFETLTNNESEYLTINGTRLNLNNLPDGVTLTLSGNASLNTSNGSIMGAANTSLPGSLTISGWPDDVFVGSNWRTNDSNPNGDPIQLVSVTNDQGDVIAFDPAAAPGDGQFVAGSNGGWLQIANTGTVDFVTVDHF